MPWAENFSAWKQPISTMRAFLPLLGRSPEDDPLIQQYLMVNSLHEWRMAALRYANPRQFDTWVKITGEAIVRPLYQQRQSIIFLNSHVGPTRLMLVVFDRMNVGPVVHLAGGATGRMPSEEMHKHVMQETEHILLNIGISSNTAASLYLARQLLEQHGLVHIVADAYADEAALILPFLGRQRPFGPGFAQLAVMTNALVLPVFTSLQASGQINIEFLPPLDAGTAAMGHQKRVDSLIRQYATVLEQRWRDDPANISAVQLRWFLSLPLVPGT